MKYPETIKNNKWRARKNFLIDLSKEIWSEIKTQMEVSEYQRSNGPEPKKARMRCSICLREKDIKTKSKCAICSQPMCTKHMESVCYDCL